MNYIEVIKTALFAFPIVAFIFTIPFILIEYHRYGSINKFRTFIVYSFILYLITIYFLVILPLPEISEVEEMTSPYFNLMPFSFVKDIIDKSSFVLTNPHTYLKSLANPCIYVAVFNIFMTMPFGMYLRYYYKCSFKKTVFFTFLLSLFFELTQLSGLYFIYPRPYRLFDVDDLLLNTLGGGIGYLIMGLFLNHLPSRDKIDEKSKQVGERVSGLRRITLYLLDTFIYMFLLILINLFIKNSYTKYILFILYFVIIPYFMDCSTLGGKFLNVKLNFPDKKILRLFLRALITYFNYFGLVYFVALGLFKLNNYSYFNTVEKLCLFGVVFIGLFLFYIINIFTILFKSKAHYDKYTGVLFKSTINKDKQI